MTHNHHDYLFLPQRQVFSCFAHFDQEEGRVQLRDGKDEHTVNVPDRARGLLLLSLVGRIPYGDSLEKILKLYWKLEPEVSYDFGLNYRGVRFSVSFHPSGEFEVEVEPGMGTTICRIRVGSGEAAYEVVMGMIHLLMDDPHTGKPYLTRA